MILKRFFKLFTSLRLTVVLLGMGIILVFWGTIAQVHLGLYKAQNDFFRSFFVFWEPKGSGLRIPIFPGGYLVGSLLILNLFAAHFRYYQPGKKKVGIILIHLGLVLLLFGQLLTDFLAVESTMHIREGRSKNYSESTRDFELAVVDSTDSNFDKVVAVPGHRLARRQDITVPDLPFTIRVKAYYPNSSLMQTNRPGYEPVQITAGFGAGIFWKRLPHETETDLRDMPSGTIEILTPQGSLGTYLVTAFLVQPHEFDLNGRHFEMLLRSERFYKPFSLKLLEFRFDRYSGTDIPKNFSSRVELQRPDTGEDREVVIKMNTPLRYKGETFYQADWDRSDEKGTILQVVRNPGWLTPYLACVMVAAGLVTQFLSHLIGFATKRRSK